MIKNYFKIAFRSFWKHKLFTFINIIGLSIGISAALVIYLIVHFDFTFDKFHKDGDRIYRVVTNYSFSGEQGYNSGVCGPLTIAVKTQVTGLETSAPFYTLSNPNVLIEKAGAAPAKFKNQDNVILADGRYFKLFEYKWLAGSAATALNAPNQVVLTSGQAKIYFPELAYNQMIGKTITYDTLKVAVTGIVQTIEKNTDFAFHDFISYSTGISNKSLKDELQLTEWQSTNSATQLFVKVSPLANISSVEKQLNDLLKKNTPPKAENKGNTTDFHLQPLSDLHFNSKYETFNTGRTANKNTLYGILAIGIFLLILGCINFINLTTAQASQRAKEIGIRKTMGSTRKQLIGQFLSETFIITLLAIIISLGLTPIILKLFADFIPPGIKMSFIDSGLIPFLLLLLIAVSLLSGFYPAILLSGYKPVSVLKNQTKAGLGQTRNAWLRKSLTVTQFIIAQFFIMATVLVSKQVYYALHKDMGFKKDAIIVLNTPWKSRQLSITRVLLNKLSAIPQVELISTGNAPPSAGVTQSTEALYKDGKKEIKTEVQQKYGDENYVKLFHIKIIAGRALTTADSTSAILINKTYANVLGFQNPAKAVNKILDYNGKKMQIAGVTGDFFQKSLRNPVKPLAILIATKSWQAGAVHIALKPESAGGNDWKNAIVSVQQAWHEVYPDDEFDYSFLDKSIAKFYDNEQHTSTLLSWATGLSIFISCLGLLGLAIYTTNLRTKEIGVRKVLGASVAQIVTLLSTEMVLLILLAFVVVTPVAWYAMNKWMQNYADRTTISWWIFVLSGASMLLAAIFTSGFQTLKAAIANPVKSLRSE